MTPERCRMPGTVRLRWSTSAARLRSARRAQSPVAAGERFCEACGADLGLPPAAAAPLPRPRRLPPRHPRLAARSPATSAGATSPTTATARSAGRGRRASATTSASSPPPGWRRSATAACATPATRMPCPLGRAGGHAVLVVCDGVSPRRTPTSPAWPPPGPPVTCWPAPGRRRRGRSPSGSPRAEGPGGGGGRGQRGGHRQHHRGRRATRHRARSSRPW